MFMARTLLVEVAIAPSYIKEGKAYQYLRMYVYGGYDINTGIMNDFNVIDLSGDIEWQTISMESQDGYPGRRCNHTAVVYDGWMIVFGGKVGSLTNTDQI